ncbi:MAG: TRAP transporter large permease [Pseudolabrys sp.]
MEWYYTLTLLIGGLVAFMLIGLPVVFAFFAINLIGAWFVMGGDNGVLQLMRNSVQSVQSFALLPIPLFIFMGEIMFYTGIAARAIDAVDRLIARVPGRLSLVAIVGGTIFSSLSGSTIANTAMLSSTLLPEMYKRGYKPSISIGPIVATGGLAMLIPPSALAVLLGSIALIPISDLLVASIIPALILATMFFAYVTIRCWINPAIAPPLGAAASMVAAVFYRKLTWESFRVSVTQTLRFTVMTLFIICGSTTFSQILSFSEATASLSTLITQSGLPPMVIIVSMLAVLMFLGCFMDQVSMMMITAPIFMPMVQQLGYQIVWFGVLMLMTLEISLATPPFGLLLFVAKGAVPQGTTMRQIIVSVTPFIGMALIVVAIILAFPAVTLVLPSLIQH